MKISCAALACTLCLLLSSSASSGADDAPLDGLKLQLSKSFPDSTIVNIVAFGDSVPAGYGVTPKVSQATAYPRLVSEFLNDRYPTAVLNVITSAVGGENSREGLKRFAQDVGGMRPSAVLIDYGLNDRLIPRGESEANMKALITLCRAFGSVPVLVTPNPDLNGEPPGSYSTLPEQTDLIRQVAKSEGVPLADAAAAFASYNGDVKELMATNGHPNAHGHQLIAGTITALFDPQN